MDAAENGACDDELRHMIASLIPDMAKWTRREISPVATFARERQQAVS